MKKLSILIATLAFAVSAQAAIVEFDLRGTAGFGLLPGNEPGSIIGGTGGEIGLGIFYSDLTDADPATNQLTLNIGWGTGNGFTDLSSNVTNQHIHGPVATNFGNGFTQTSGNTIALTRTSNSPSSGQISNNVVSLTALQTTDLFNGKFYVNVHTANNTGGEIRGFLVPVPEPTSVALLGAASLVFLGRRRRS